MDFGASTIEVAMDQLIRGWMETIVQLAEGSEEWPKPHAIHVRQAPSLSLVLVIFSAPYLHTWFSFPTSFPQFNFAGGDSAIESTKRIMGPACKTLLWWSSAVSSMLAHLSDYDFVKIAEEIYADPARRDGRSLEDIVQQVRLFGSFPT
jgi:hypothetical protein